MQTPGAACQPLDTPLWQDPSCVWRRGRHGEVDPCTTVNKMRCWSGLVGRWHTSSLTPGLPTISIAEKVAPLVTVWGSEAVRAAHTHARVACDTLVLATVDRCQGRSAVVGVSSPLWRTWTHTLRIRGSPRTYGERSRALAARQRSAVSGGRAASRDEEARSG